MSDTLPNESGGAAPALDREAYERYLPLVRRVALRTAQAPLPRNVNYDDVLRAGWAGLVIALRKRGNGSEEDFLSYAAYRVRLSVLEFLKSHDPAARQMRTASLRISEAMTALIHRHGRIPEESDVATELGLDLEGYRSLLNQIAQSGWVRLELTAESEDHGDIMLQSEQMAGRIERIITALPDQYQVILGLYYQEKCELREIAEVLGMDEIRAGQVHAQAVHLIRSQLKGGPIS